MSKRSLAILAALGATTIYGLNHTIAKGVMPHYVQPFGFIFLRVCGACLLFWLIAPAGPRQLIEKRDWGRMLVCAVFGMAINMLAFFKGLQLSTPVNSSILVTVTPIIVAVLSLVLIRERILPLKAVGIVLGLAGALTLILLNEERGLNAPNIPLGNALLLVNAISYGLYLILVKKLLEKYHPFVLMRWLFAIGVVVTVPFTFGEFSQIRWAEIPAPGLASIAFVVVGTTFLTYLFNVFALTQLKASTISVFMYAQPVIGILFAIGSGRDRLSWINALAALLVLSGVYLATRRPKPGPSAS